MISISLYSRSVSSWFLLPRRPFNNLHNALLRTVCDMVWGVFPEINHDVPVGVVDK